MRRNVLHLSTWKAASHVLWMDGKSENSDRAARAGVVPFAESRGEVIFFRWA
jgi:hypothetical protein